MTRYEIECIKDLLYSKCTSIEFKSHDEKFIYVPIEAVDHLDEVKFDDKAGKVRLTDDFSMDDIITILSDGLADECAFEKVDYDKNAYYEAKEALLKEGWVKDEICLEAVQAKMLMKGDKLVLYEVDSHQRHDLYLKDILNALYKVTDDYMKKCNCTRLHATTEILSKGDFFDYEGILQVAVFGEVIYG